MMHGEPGEPCCRFRMKILPGRTALKTLDTMALCTARLSSSLLGIISRTVILL